MIQKDTIVTLTEEAEERYAPEAKRIEALPFQGRGTGLSPVRSTMKCIKDITVGFDWAMDNFTQRARSRISV